MHDVEQKLRILFGDWGIHSHRQFLRACQLRRKHRGFAEDRDASFADLHHHALMPAFEQQVGETLIAARRGVEIEMRLVNQNDRAFPSAYAFFQSAV